MNKIGLASITVLMIGLLAFVAVVGMGVLMVDEFYSAPGNDPMFVNDTFGSQYNQAYSGINGTSNTISSLGQPSSQSAFSTGLQGLGAVITTAVIGLSAIGAMFGLITQVKVIIGFFATGPFPMQLLIGFLSAAAGIYITMKIIQAARGTNIEP